MGGGGPGGKEEEQDGMSVHSPCKAPPSSASSLSKEQSEAELELRFLEGLEIYPPGKLKGSCDQPPSVGGITQVLERLYEETHIIKLYNCVIATYTSGIHRHFVIYGLMEFLRRSLDRQFSSEEVLHLLDRFYNLEMLRGEDEDAEFPNREEDFSLPQSYFVKDES